MSDSSVKTKQVSADLNTYLYGLKVKGKLRNMNYYVRGKSSVLVYGPFHGVNQNTANRQTSCLLQ